MEREIIGWIELPEDKVMHKADYECAAWYEDILVKAGKYPVVLGRTLKVDVNGECKEKVDNCYELFEGTIVSDYFGSLYCGMPISSYDCEKNAGQEAKYSPFVYGFMLVESVKNGSVKLEEGWEVVDYTFEYEGETIEMCSIVRAKNEEQIC